ncbi:MAG: hypothetical protein ACI308_04545 [Muribaculaceae bacterium]
MNNNKNKIIALIATLAVHIAVALILVFTALHYQWPPDDLTLEEMPQEEILFGGEYVQLGNVEQPRSQDLQPSSPANATEVADEPKLPGSELKDAGEAQERPKEVVTSKAESPMKVKKQEPEKTKPQGSTKSEQTEQDKQKAQQEAERKKISSRVQFGSSSGSGSGTAGSPNGNSTSGVASGKPGIGGLGGYTLESWSRPSSTLEGTITVQVKVNARGNVVSASYAGGTGAAAGNAAARSSCVAAAKASSFSVPKNTTTDAVGTITYHFE